MLQGQLRRVGELFYNTKVDIYVVEEAENPEDNTIHVKFRLLFNNVAFRENNRASVDSVVDNIPLRSASYVVNARWSGWSFSLLVCQWACSLLPLPRLVVPVVFLSFSLNMAFFVDLERFSLRLFITHISYWFSVYFVRFRLWFFMTLLDYFFFFSLRAFCSVVGHKFDKDRFVCIALRFV